MPQLVLIIRRALLVGSLIAGAMALNVWATGGVSVSLGALHLSSRNPMRPLSLGLLLAAGWLLLRFVPGGRTSIGSEWRWWRHKVRFRPVPPIVTVACLCAAADVARWLRGAPLWLDEQMIAINFRDRSFADLSGTLWLGQSAPLAWLWAQRSVLLLLGPEERVLRLVPLFFGLATLAAAAWIGRRWLSAINASLFVVVCWIGRELSHYRFELKHYSADVFFALLLPALAVWTVEAASPISRLRRQVGWFAVAGVGLWFANGALLVAPGCVLWMLAAYIRERDFAGGSRFAVAGVIWLALFAGHYTLSTRYTHHNAYLRQHWANRVAPASGGLGDTLTWFGSQLAPVARDAGGTRLPLLFWIAGSGGLLMASRRRLAAAYALVPLSAAVLAAGRLVPFYGRFSLWIVPALYLGLVFAIGRGAEWLAAGYRRRRGGLLLAGGITTALAVVVTADVVDHGRGNLEVGGSAESNHSSDDRSGVPWLMRQRQAGDAILTTRLGWPAIWWYGDISLATSGDGRLPDGTTMYELTYHQHRQRCVGVDSLRQHRRFLFYISFPDIPAAAYPGVEREVLALGSVAAHRQFTSETRGFVVRVDGTAPVGTVAATPRAASPTGGCIEVEPARRW